MITGTGPDLVWETSQDPELTLPMILFMLAVVAFAAWAHWAVGGGMTGWGGWLRQRMPEADPEAPKFRWRHPGIFITSVITALCGGTVAVVGLYEYGISGPTDSPRLTFNVILTDVAFHLIGALLIAAILIALVLIVGYFIRDEKARYYAAVNEAPDKHHMEINLDDLTEDDDLPPSQDEVIGHVVGRCIRCRTRIVGQDGDITRCPGCDVVTVVCEESLFGDDGLLTDEGMRTYADLLEKEES